MNKNGRPQFQRNYLRSNALLLFLIAIALLGRPDGGSVLGQQCSFDGSYTAPGTSLRITGSTATEHWASGPHGTNTWSNCSISGNTMTCNWTGTYEGDPDKTVDRRGTLTATLNGASLSLTSNEDEPTFHWNVKPYPSAIHKGAVWHVTFTREGGAKPCDPGTTTQTEGENQIRAKLLCDQPLELVPGGEPSEICEICISGWRKNTSDPVEVVFPQQDDWWGSHAQGIVLFAGGNDENEIIKNMSRPPYDMEGVRCSGADSKWGTYPWNIFIRARSTAPPGVSTIPIIVRQKGAGSVNLNLDLKVLAGRSTKPPPPNQDIIPLKLFWSSARGDNFTTATSEGERAALAAGYQYVRIEGYVFRTQQPGTVPLKLYYSGAREDNYTTANAQGEGAAQAAHYVFVRVEGYVYPKQQPGTVPLKNYWNDSRGDNFTTATAEGERDALSSNYKFAWIEGYILASDRR